jgi:hypothetical protein
MFVAVAVHIQNLNILKKWKNRDLQTVFWSSQFDTVKALYIPKMYDTFR